MNAVRWPTIMWYRFCSDWRDACATQGRRCRCRFTEEHWPCIIMGLAVIRTATWWAIREHVDGRLTVRTAAGICWPGSIATRCPAGAHQSFLHAGAQSRALFLAGGLLRARPRPGRRGCPAGRSAPSLSRTRHQHARSGRVPGAVVALPAIVHGRAGATAGCAAVVRRRQARADPSARGGNTPCARSRDAAGRFMVGGVESRRRATGHARPFHRTGAGVPCPIFPYSSGAAGARSITACVCAGCEGKFAPARMECGDP